MLTPKFKLLLHEAQFTKEMLGTGATQIRLANYAAKGIYFQSFVSLSTGLERIGKICLMLDHYIESGGQFPTMQEMKVQIGHKLETLYTRSQVIVEKRSINMQLTRDLSSPIHLAITKVLHDFAQGDRYSNIDALVGNSALTGPMGRWHQNVDTPLYESRVSLKRKEKIAHNARLGARLMDGVSYILHISETGDEIVGYEDASTRTGIWEAVAPYRQLAVLQVIRYWTELVTQLGHIAQGMPGENIPYFGEIFAIFYNEDKYLKSRKTWQGIR